MSSDRTAFWSIQRGSPNPRQQLSELVLAWGKDVHTGEARYIFELDETHRGSKCNCVCYCCGEPLTAVNAAKAEWRKRPHFRHPDGTDRHSCLVLTARAAALELLEKQDRVVLPARRVSAQVVGLSGAAYSAWISQPAEAVNIRSFKPLDQVRALLTLEDGRTVVVQLTGSLSEELDGALHPVVQVVMDDPTLAALDPNELKGRLHLLVEAGSWHGQHWSDASLAEQAHSLATAKAVAALDWLPDEALQDLGPTAGRESLLHWLTKDVLRREERLRVPELVLREPLGGAGSKLHHEVARRDESLLELSNVRLEEKVGQIRPDIIAQFVDPVDGARGTLLIEVTVTNAITAERLDRIRAEGFAALEINVGSLGGTLSRAEFTALVVHELAAKRWLAHPWLDEKAATRAAQLELELQADEQELARLRSEYLAAVKSLAALRAEDVQTQEARQLQESTCEHIAQLGKELALYGLVHGDDPVLYAWQGSVLDRLLSIQENAAWGYRVETLWQVLNTALVEKAEDKLCWHTLYLMALRAYKPTLEPQHRARVTQWREKVRQDLESCSQRGVESVYKRSRRFDPLLGFLFPEMRELLARPLPGEGTDKRPGRAPSQPRDVNRRPTNSSAPMHWSREPDWLKGAELEDWKRKNPEAAVAWDDWLKRRTR